MKKLLTYASIGVLTLASSACATSSNLNDVTGQVPTVSGSRPSVNVSPMDPAIQCFSQATSQRLSSPVRIAVGNVRDYTGKFSNEASEGGFRITQGGSLMVMSTLGKLPGIELVERFDLDVANNEATMVRNRLIQDPIFDPASNQPTSLRTLRAGQYQGSDYYIVGGITEVNYSIRSGGAELGVSLFEVGARYVVMNVAADLRLVDTQTLRVVRTVSIQKQIVGSETRAGVFRFFGDYLVDLNAGTRDQEPMQMGVRAALEYGTLDLLSPVFGNYFAECAPLVESSFRS